MFHFSTDTAPLFLSKLTPLFVKNVHDFFVHLHFTQPYFITTGHPRSLFQWVHKGELVSVIGVIIL